MAATPAILVPTGTFSNSFTVTGAATAHAALADNSDASYISSPSGSSSGGRIQYDRTFSLPALAQIRQVLWRVRWSTAGTDGVDNHNSEDLEFLNAVGFPANVTNVFSPTPTGITEFTRTMPLSPDGDAWTQLDLSAVDWLYAQTFSLPAQPIIFYRTTLEVTYNEAPVAAVTAPSGSVSSTNTPAITWTYTDPESDVQERYRVKVFDSATYSGGGFNPETSTPVWDSTEVLSSVTSATTAPLAQFVTYKAYVKVADTGSGGRYGNWVSGSTFSIVPVAGLLFDPPAIPALLSATPDSVNNRVTVALQGRDNMLTRNQSSAETGVLGVVPNANCAVVRDTTAGSFLHGVASFKMTATASANMSAVTMTNAANGTSAVPCLPGQNLVGLGSFKAAATGRACSLTMSFFNAAGTFISSVTGLVVVDTTTGWTQAVVSATAPALSAFVAIIANVNAIPGGTAVAAAESHWVDQLSIAPRVVANVNRLTANQASVETDSSGWTTTTNCTVSRTTAASTFLDLAAALALTSVAAGTMGTKNAPSGTVAVVAGQSWTASAFFRAAVSVRNVGVNINWRDGALALLSTTAGTVVADTTTGWVQASVVGVAPVGAVFATMEVQVNSAGAASEVHYVDSMMLALTDDVTWTRGGFAIEMGKLLDTFTRADSASTLGSSEGPGTPAWSAAVGTWGIQTGKAYLVSATAQAIALLTSPILADGLMTCDITLSGTANRAAAGLVFRALDGTNHLLVEILKTGTGVQDAITIYKDVAGVYTSLAQYSSAGLVNGSTYGLKVEFFGGRILVGLDRKAGAGYVNVLDLQMGASDVNIFTTASYNKYGLRVNNGASADDGGTRFDNFLADDADTQVMLVERSTDGGVTWTGVRTMTRVALTDPLEQGSFIDYEAPRGTAVRYRVRAQATETAIVTVTSGYSDALLMSPNLVSDGQAWLKSPTAPALNVPVSLIKDSANSDSEEDLTTYAPLGRADFLVHGGTVRLEEFGGLEFFCANDAAWNAFEALRKRQEPLLLQTCYGDTVPEEFWVRLGPKRSVSRLTMTTAPGQLRRVKVPARQVIAPVVT